MESKSSNSHDPMLRVFVTLPASYTVAGSRAEGEPVAVHRCRTRSIALDRIVIEADTAPPEDTKIHLNVPGLGIYAGQVQKRIATGFVVNITFDAAAVAKLTPRLGWLKRYLARQIDNRRTHARHRLPPYPVQLCADDGTEIPATLYDLSSSGLAVLTDARPAIGERFTLGGITGTVARLFEGGLALFIDPPRQLDELREQLLPQERNDLGARRG
ncbi:hypothetical protein [Pelagibacterium xiamenense]|uniref:hypothetical protein n=1 Tax=Pelagibacterium xiamenense TaxID=2901140 RepID=UPI001E34276F|nr:hypothetical protein [Pelagibacterium xiamenense]MCD7058612.1 hypothetical protein [Pelagibacterium xiamenense]